MLTTGCKSVDHGATAIGWRGVILYNGEVIWESEVLFQSSGEAKAFARNTLTSKLKGLFA